MIESPSGALNGAITPGELNSIFGDSGPTGALSRAIANGDVSAYLRTWANQPPNGAFVQVTAAQFPSSADASAALAGAVHGTSTNHFGHFAVPEIPYATGVTLITNSQNGLINEEIVQFAKGTILFDVGVGQVTTAANSGQSQLSEADVIQIARHQATLAPGPNLSPTNPDATQSTAYKAGEYVGPVLLVFFVVGLIVLIVQRRRKGASAARAQRGIGSLALDLPPTSTLGGAPVPSPVAMSTAMANSVGRRSAVLDRPPRTMSNAFHCSRCGERVPIGTDIDHDCGQRHPAGTYCMSCGTQFEHDAIVCRSCGRRKL
jgi:hypothetical protein